MAAQLASVTEYLSEQDFVLWDVHLEDVLVDAGHGRQAPHVMLLDVFMPPSEINGYHWACGFDHWGYWFLSRCLLVCAAGQH